MEKVDQVKVTIRFVRSIGDDLCYTISKKVCKQSEVINNVVQEYVSDANSRIEIPISVTAPKSVIDDLIEWMKIHSEHDTFSTTSYESLPAEVRAYNTSMLESYKKQPDVRLLNYFYTVADHLECSYLKKLLESCLKECIEQRKTVAELRAYLREPDDLTVADHAEIKQKYGWMS